MTGKRNPVPALTAIDPNPATANRQIHQWAKQVSPVMYQAVSPMVGTLPVPAAPSNAYLMWAGTPAIAFSAGVGVYNFPNAFPNGVLSAVFMVEAGGANADGGLYTHAISLAQIQLFFSYGGTPFTGTIGVSGIVIGW